MTTQTLTCFKACDIRGKLSVELNDGSGFVRIRRAMADYPEVRFSIEEAQGGVWTVFEQLEGSQPESIAEQVLALLKSEVLAKQEISQRLGQKNISGTLNKVIRELLAQGLIEMTHPEKPNSRLQKYRHRRATQ